MSEYIFYKLLIALFLINIITTLQATNITGAGASSPYPIYTKWAADYKLATKRIVNYQSIGSGGGKQQIIAQTVNFGASDDPMTKNALERNNLIQFPAIIGGIVIIVNVDGIQPGQLKLSGKVLADIFMGFIKKWNDSAIKILNPNLRFPDADITVIHRADGSGTTFGITNYLSKISPKWKEIIGEGKSVKWPVGQGGKGNEGVAAYVSQLKNTIGYIEYTYAKQNNLAWTLLENRDGKFVQPELRTFAAAAANADWLTSSEMNLMLTNERGFESWPITVASFIIIHKTQVNPKQGQAVLEFFDWAFKYGKDSAINLGYLPIPESVTEVIRTSWYQIKGVNKQPIWK